MEKSIEQQKAELSAKKNEGRMEKPVAPDLEPFVERARETFVRCERNPILTPADMPFPCKAVCNPGACLFEGETLLLLRVIDDDNHSHLHVARSKDGVTDWRIEKEALLTPRQGAAWYDDWGCEDPRITYMPECGEYMIVYVGWSRLGAGVCLASTRDFRTAERMGLMIHPYNKDAALFPRKIDGQYHLLHRPTAGPLENIWVSRSDDLIHWGDPRCVLEESDQPGWDSGKVGTGPPPIETTHGWLLIYHGVQQVDNGWEYRCGMAMLDKDDPSKVLGRWPAWIFGPKEPYEFQGNKPGIVFPTGLVVRDHTQYVYYGAADTCIGLATAKIDMLQQLRNELSEKFRDGDLQVV